jgi:phosphoglycolate phosphatase
MKLKPEEVLYIGDSMVDIKTAKNTGIDSVGVLWGFRSYEELNKYGATYIISNPKEILTIVK